MSSPPPLPLPSYSPFLAGHHSPPPPSLPRLGVPDLATQLSVPFPPFCQEQLAGMAMVNPEEFLQSLAPGVRARVEALQVRAAGFPGF